METYRKHPVYYLSRLVLLATAGLVLSACSLPYLTPTPAPTHTPRPATTTPAPTATATAVPAPTPAPTHTPTAPPRPALSSQGDTLPTPLPRPSPRPALPCTVTADALTLREGPGTAYRSIAVLPRGAEVFAFKCTPAGDWLLVETRNKTVGWMYAAFVACRGNPASLPVAPTPALRLPSPTPPPTESPLPTAAATLPPPVPQAWRGEYFDNASLQGPPVLVRFDPELAFDWILNSPAPGLPADNFSVRWSRPVDFFEGGDYRFFAEVDDGLRIRVDGQTVLDAWHNFAPLTYQGDLHDLLPGVHMVTVEYFESGSHARIKVWWEKMRLADDAWQASYYPNPDLQAPALLVRRDETLDFDWGQGAPDSGLGNNFSARWLRSFFFEQGGDYTFSADIAEKDRVKIFLDGWMVVDAYREDGGVVSGVFSQVAPGAHTITVEYADLRGEARIKVWWSRN